LAQIICNNAYPQDKVRWGRDAHINEAIRNDSLQDLFIIVPTGKIIRYLRSVITKAYYTKHNKPVTKLNLFTLQSFVKYCYGRLFPPFKYRIISDAYQFALFEEAAESANLNFYKVNSRSQGHVLQRLASIVFGLKEDGITPESLRKDISEIELYEKYEIEPAKLGDIAILFEEYERILGDKFLDFPALLRLTINRMIHENAIIDKQAETSFPELFPEIKATELFPEGTHIFMSGFSEFKPPETMFLSLFAKHKIPFGIQIDYDVKNGPLFGNLEDSIIHLTKAGNRLLSQDETPKNEGNEAASVFLRRWLFNRERETRTNKLNDIIKIVQADDRSDEVRSIAKLIRYLNLIEQVPLPEICICCRQPELYSGLFREKFNEYRIPVNISDRFSLAVSPVVTAIFSLMDIVLKGYTYRDIHKALHNPFLSFDKINNKSDRNDFDAINLLNFAQKLRITGGHRTTAEKSWELRLKQHVDYLYDRLISLNDSYADTTEIESAQMNLVAAKKAYSDFIHLKSLIKWQNTAILPDECSAIIKDRIIKEFSIPENISRGTNNIKFGKDVPDRFEQLKKLEDLEKSARALATFTGLLDEMTYILKDRYPGKKFNLDFYARKLKSAVSACRYQVHEKPAYGVTVTSIEQTREIPYKVMILCGAVDNEFPIAYKPESFLGKELPDTEIRHLQSERMLFFQFLVNAPAMLDAGSRKIYLFYPKQSESLELVRSRFIDSLIKICDFKDNDYLIDLSKARKGDYDSGPESDNDTDSISDKTSSKYPEQWVSAICSKNEVLNIIGRKYGGRIIGNYNELLFDRVMDASNAIGLADESEFIQNFVRNRNGSVTDRVRTNDLSADEKKYLERFRTNGVSISELETYAGCPFKFFVYYILKIKEPVSHELSISSQEQGSVIHQILYKFFTTLQLDHDKSSPITKISTAGNLPPLIPVVLDPREYENYRHLLLHIANEELEAIRFAHPFYAIEEEEILGNDRKVGSLELWLQSELDRVAGNWQFQPGLFEFAFGTRTHSGKLANLPPVKIDDNLIVKGKIDRIEFLHDGNELYYLVADYKSSFNYLPNNRDISLGIAFQVPLYLAASEIFLKEYYSLDSIPSGGVYYSLNPQYDRTNKKVIHCRFLMFLPGMPPGVFAEPDKKGKYVLNDPNMYDLLIKEALDHAINYLSEISGGEFPVDPQSNAQCKFCKLKSLCRVDEKEIFNYS
jgi:ATP-dependent helicase/DNAse subunit B